MYWSMWICAMLSIFTADAHIIEGSRNHPLVSTNRCSYFLPVLMWRHVSSMSPFWEVFHDSVILHTHTHTHLHTHTHQHTHMHTCTRAHMRKHMLVCMHMHTCMHTHMHSRHTNQHTHALSPTLSSYTLHHVYSCILSHTPSYHAPSPHPLTKPSHHTLNISPHPLTILFCNISHHPLTTPSISHHAPSPTL